jgi:hypothetical protein
VSNPKQIANIFNKFFTTIADEIASLINPTNVQNSPTNDDNTNETGLQDD